MHHMRTVLVCVFGTIAMAGLIASTTEDLRALTLVAIPGALQLPGIILIGMLCGFAVRSAAAATIALVAIAIGGAFLSGLSIAFAGFQSESAYVFLLNRGTVQGFFALILIFCFGMIGVVMAMLMNVFVRQLDI
ncbi:hypothetical protein BH20CHL1_BH20CHL1_00220 [soil metagenome]